MSNEELIAMRVREAAARAAAKDTARPGEGSPGSACCGAAIVSAPDLDGWMCDKCCNPQPSPI